MSRSFQRGRSLVLLSLAAIVASASGARAENAPECGAWTWFPDFRCENREARPDDAFNPVGMPYLFEDPYITTGLNFAYIYHRLPDGNTPLGLPVQADTAFDGGGIHDLALQIRLALTPNLAFIATKDGLAILRPGNNAVVEQDTGILDMTVGFKYKLFESESRDFVITPAIRYEIPMGTEGLFQGLGDGVFIPSASFRWGRAGFNVIGSLGGQVPIDDDANVRSLFYNLHLDYGIPIEGSFLRYVVPFVEFNGMHYTRNGNGRTPVQLATGGTIRVPLAFEGFDFANLGSPVIDGKDVLVMVGGVRLPTTFGVSFALAYEGPLTNRQDIHNQRFTFMATYEF